MFSVLSYCVATNLLHNDTDCCIAAKNATIGWACFPRRPPARNLPVQRGCAIRRQDRGDNPMAITGFDHLAITVADVDATFAFYDKLFGIRRGMDYALNGKTLVREMLIGGAKMNVHQAGNGVELVARKPTPGSVDVCFRWDQPIETALALLAKHNVAVADGPSPRTFSDGRPSTSVYFRDP